MSASSDGESERKKRSSEKPDGPQAESCNGKRVSKVTLRESGIGGILIKPLTHLNEGDIIFLKVEGSNSR